MVPQQIVDHGKNFLLLYPYPAIGLVLSSLALAYLLACVSARIVYHGFDATIENRYSPWHQVLRDEPEQRDVYATVDLKDGTTVAGWIIGYTVGELPYSEREIVLAAGRNIPLKTRPSGAEHFLEMLGTTLIIPGGEINSVALQYFTR